jgi:hypothetical protein
VRDKTGSWARFAVLAVLLAAVAGCFGSQPTNVMVVCDPAVDGQTNGCHAGDLHDLLKTWIASQPAAGDRFVIRLVTGGAGQPPEKVFRFPDWAPGVSVGRQQAVLWDKYRKETDGFLAMNERTYRLPPPGDLGYRDILGSVYTALRSADFGQRWKVVLISNLLHYNAEQDFAAAVPDFDEFKNVLNSKAMTFAPAETRKIDFEACGYSPAEYVPGVQEKETRNIVVVVCDNSGSGKGICNREIVEKLFRAWVDKTIRRPGSKFVVLRFDEDVRSIDSPVWFDSTVPAPGHDAWTKERIDQWADDEVDREMTRNPLPKPTTDRSPIAEAVWNAIQRHLRPDLDSKKLLIVISDLRQESPRKGACPEVNFSDPDAVPDPDAFTKWAAACGYMTPETKGVIQGLYVCGFHTQESTWRDPVNAAQINAIETSWRRYFAGLGAPSADTVPFALRCEPDLIPWPLPRPSRVDTQKWQQIEKLWGQVFVFWGLGPVRPTLACR